MIEECLLVGYQRFAGVLEGGMEAWSKAGREVARAELARASRVRRMLSDGAVAVDVRELNEFKSGHVAGALHIPLGELELGATTIPADVPIVTYCGHGERSATALSLLERLGFTGLVNFDGGFDAWQEEGLPVDR